PRSNWTRSLPGARRQPCTSSPGSWGCARRAWRCPTVPRRWPASARPRPSASSRPPTSPSVSVSTPARARRPSWPIEGPGPDGGAAVSAHGGSRAVVAALGANLGIAAIKFVAFGVTGSASMLAEGVHSVVDSGNQGLLLVGARSARRRATPEHPFGYGRDRYVY